MLKFERFRLNGVITNNQTKNKLERAITQQYSYVGALVVKTVDSGS